MQKDVHFYLTYALAQKAGISRNDAVKIAWADQYTDDLTEAELHGIQTQSAIIGNWSDRQIQRSVLVPFHFIPGDDAEHPWAVTESSCRAIALLNEAVADVFRVGIALHTYQDTFSHQGWTGWNEKFNACFPWYYIQSGIPEIGHAEMQAMPDIVTAVWTDPRNSQSIDNKKRVLRCAMKTFLQLQRFLAASRQKLAFTIENAKFWPKIAPDVKRWLEVESYDRRKETALQMVGAFRKYRQISNDFREIYKQEFIRAASQHLSLAMELTKDLPGPEDKR